MPVLWVYCDSHLPTFNHCCETGTIILGRRSRRRTRTYILPGTRSPFNRHGRPSPELGYSRTSSTSLTPRPAREGVARSLSLGCLRAGGIAGHGGEEGGRALARGRGVFLPAGMFRTTRSLLLRKLSGGRSRSPCFSGVRSPNTFPLNISSRCIFDEPLPLHRASYAERFPPLSHPLLGLTLPPPISYNVRQHPTRITILPNGLKVASEESIGPAACIGLYVDCGSIHETEASSGTTQILERMAFKGTRNRSHLQLVREIEATGGNVGASASREHLGYTYDTLKTYVPEALEILVDSVRNPIFLDSEIKEQVSQLKTGIRDPHQILLESLHLVGYSGALAKPLIADDRALDSIDGSSVGKFHFDNYTPDRMVLAAYGLDHDQLMAIAEPMLHDMKRGFPLASPQSNYTGGEIRHQEDSEKTHVALAFEVPGGWREDKNATAMTVFQFLMGGGGSFSSGGPGKGMHSRLYLRVLNRYHQVQSIEAFSNTYNDSGLFGIYMTTGSEFVGKLVEIAARELLAVATPGQVAEIEFQRAKNAVKSAIFMNLESRMIVTEDIGRQLLTFGHRKHHHFLRLLDELTLSDLTTLAQRMISTGPTMACAGDVDRVPSYEAVSRLFSNSI